MTISVACNLPGMMYDCLGNVLSDGKFVGCRPMGAYGVPLQYERSFRWKLGQFRYLCQSNQLASHIKINCSRSTLFEDSFQQVCLSVVIYVYVTILWSNMYTLLSCAVLNLLWVWCVINNSNYVAIAILWWHIISHLWRSNWYSIWLRGYAITYCHMLFYSKYIYMPAIPSLQNNSMKA